MLVISVELFFSKWCDRSYSHSTCSGRICALGQVTQQSGHTGRRPRPMASLRPLLSVFAGQHGLFACEQCTSQVGCAFGFGLLLHSVSLERISHQYWETSSFLEGHSRVGERYLDNAVKSDISAITNLAFAKLSACTCRARLRHV